MNRSLSPSYSHHLVSQSISSNAFTGIMPSATDEVLKLRKELRQKESEFSKEKALLLQKVELLELQVIDVVEREESQRRMHEAMINCLKKDDPTQSQSAASAVERVAQSEIQELREQKKRMIDDFDAKERESKRQLLEKEALLKDLQQSVDRLTMEKRHYQQQMESERKEFQSKIQMLTNERDQVGQKMEFKNQSVINGLQMEVERLKLEHQRQVEKLKSDCEASLKEIRYLHDQEKYSLEHRVERSTHELKSFISLVNSKDHSEQEQKLARKREELEKEIEVLQHEVEQIRQDWQNNIQQLQKDKDQAELRAQKALKQLEKIKNAPKPVKIDLVQSKPTEQSLKTIKNLKEEVQELQAENDKQSEQVKKFRKEITDNQDYIEKIEQNERKLRAMLKGKDNEFDSEKVELRKQLNQEKKRSLEALESTSRLRDSGERSKNRHLQEMLEKDEKIIKLTRELRETERKLSDVSTVVNTGNQAKGSQRSVSPYAFNSDQFKCQDGNTHARAISYSPINGAQHMSTQQNFMLPSGHHSNSVCNHISQPQHSPRRNGAYYAPQQAENQIMKQVSQLELTLLRTCQRMADSASRMECAYCFGLYDTSDFYEHIVQDHPQTNRNQASFTGIQPGVHQSQLSINTYQSNKQQNLTHVVKKAFAEDNPSLNASQSISPKIVLNRNISQGPPNKQKYPQGSRSFTNLLNEIEEEEKFTSHSQLSTQQAKDPQQKSNQRSYHASKPENEVKKSRNQNATAFLGGTGNTIQSVLRTQKQPLKKQNSSITSARPASQTNLTVSTGCRSEIQNLKKQNKKLSTQIEEQNFKILDVTNDCKKLKKKVTHTGKERGNSHLTTEIKGLIQQLVSYQGENEEKQGERRIKNKGLKEVLTSRQYSNLPMSTDNMVQLRSSNSISSMSGVSQHKSRKDKKAMSKSPMHIQQLTQRDKSSVNVKANKENMVKVQKKQNQVINMPKLSLPQNNAENHDSASSNDKVDSKCDTERRYHEVNTSVQICSNSPRRFQNYFEVLQSLPDSMEESTANRPRFSPTHDSSQKLSSHRSIFRHTKETLSRNNSNAPNNIYSSKMTNNSSQHNLVLYDSSNTDIFKSKVLQKRSNMKQGKNKVWCDNSMRKLDFEGGTGEESVSSSGDCQDTNENPSNCYPSLKGFEETTGIMQPSIDEDPFVTGRFCQGGVENGHQTKQFVFKASNPCSKNSTQRTHNLIDH